MERRAKVARQIFERHFSPNSIEPVNIDNSTSKSIRDAVMSQNFTPQIYDVAQYQVSDHLSSNISHLCSSKFIVFSCFSLISFR